MDQVPHRARLGDRHGRRGAGDRGCRGRAARRQPPAASQNAGGAPGRCRSGRAARRSPTASTSCTSRWTGNGSITVRVTSLTGAASAPSGGHGGPCGPASCRGPRPGSSSRQSTTPGLAVRGDHGHRRPRRADAGRLHQRHGGPARRRLRRVPALAAADPLRRHDHRLRLRRRHALDQGRHRAAWPGCRPTVQAGLFVASPQCTWTLGTRAATAAACSDQATAVFDHVSRRAGPAATGPAISRSRRPRASRGYRPTRRVRSRIRRPFTVTGSRRHRAAAPTAAPQRTLGDILTGTFAGLIAVIVVGALFITAEYRRGPDPHHAGRQPAAGPGAGGQGHRDRRRHLRRRAGRSGRRGPARRSGSLRGQRRLRVPGDVARPNCGSIARHRGAARGRRRPGPGRRRHLRRSAGAVTTVVVAIVLPVPPDRHPVLPVERRRTGCCGSPRPRPSPSSRRSSGTPRSTTPTRRTTATIPLAPWAGFAVLAGYAAVALAVAAVLLRRRDA